MSSETSTEYLKAAGGAILAGAAAMGAVALHAEPAAAYYVDARGTTVVTPGDSLSSIIHAETGDSGTQLYDHDVPAAAQANHLANPDELYPGEHLHIDGQGDFGTEQASGPLAKWQIHNAHETWWELSEFVAAAKGIPQEQAFQEMFAVNKGVDPNTQQVGDTFNLPMHQVEFTRTIEAIEQITRLRSQRAAPENIGQRPDISKPPQPAKSDQRAEPIEPATSDPRVLAREILANPDISIAPSPHDRVRKSIQNIEDDGQTFTYDIDHPGEVPVSPELLGILEKLAENHRITITSLTTGEHAATSEHYQGRAVDIAVDDSVYHELFTNRKAYNLDELIFANPPAGTMTLKNGLPYAYDEATLAEHNNHIHFSVKAAVPAASHVEVPQQPPSTQLIRPSESLAVPPFTVNTNVLSRSGLTVDQLNYILAGTPMAGLGRVLLEVEAQYGENALFVAEHAAIESAHGTSLLARTKNNLFGLNAYDSCPESCAASYPDFAASVRAYANFLLRNYLRPGEPYYSGGTTIGNVFVHYSTAGQAEAQSIAGMMNDDERKVKKKK